MKRFMISKWAMLVAAACCPVLTAQRLSDLTSPTPLPPSSTLVIGFLGGFERWNDEHRNVRKLALKLRERRGVFAETISNRNRQVALELVRMAFDATRDGVLDPEERASARIVLYGQSLGGAAAIATARDLAEMGIPVLLTIQVDSVGFHDQVVPPNVLAAANFYQHDPLTIHGRRNICAADPQKTRILGNFGASYPLHPLKETDTSWVRRTLGGSHAKLELDPRIWNQVGQLITDAISTRSP